MASSVTTKYLQSQIRAEFKRERISGLLLSWFCRILSIPGTVRAVASLESDVVKHYFLTTNMRRHEMNQNCC